MNPRPPRPDQGRTSMTRAEDIVLVAICCLTVLTLLTLVGAGLASAFGGL
jgi:hypothetical protein